MEGENNRTLILGWGIESGSFLNLKMNIVHTPVLLQECLDYLSPVGEAYENDALMIDSTLGEGGHTFNFLSKYPNLTVIGVDADKNIQAKARERLSQFGERIHFYNGWFDDFYNNYPSEYEKPNLILFDLGISVYHYEESERGFSFRYDEKLKKFSVTRVVLSLVTLVLSLIAGVSTLTISPARAMITATTVHSIAAPPLSCRS